MKLAQRVKVACLCYLRFERQFPLVATEAGYWNGDVMAVSEKECIEFEIKVSKADLRNDFTSKADKHFMYQNPENTKNSPNKFYFVVPRDLEEEAVKLCEEKGSRYGVYVYTPRSPSKKKAGKAKPYLPNLRLSRKARKLHDNPPSPHLMDQILTRSSSELCRLYLDWEALSDQLETMEEENVSSKDE